jgi:hypothetical protein
VTPEKAFAIAYAIRDYVEASHGLAPRQHLLAAIADALQQDETAESGHSPPEPPALNPGECATCARPKTA